MAGMTTPAPHRSPAPRTPIDRIGATVLNELVQMIITGDFTPGELLPPEAVLSSQFGVSRTVIRETMKRLQEKGMITVAQGRGTHVNEAHRWNVMDPLVLSTMIDHDSTLGVLDDLSAVRASLEATMAQAAAGRVDDDARAHLRERLDIMAERMDDQASFREADVAFHLAVMELSDNGLAENIARVLISHAVGSDRFTGIDPAQAFELTMTEHERIVEAISAGDPEAARVAMTEHILGSWQRRRLPNGRQSD